MNAEFLGAVFAVLSGLFFFLCSAFFNMPLDPDLAFKAHLHGKPETKAISGAMMITLSLSISMAIVYWERRRIA